MTPHLVVAGATDAIAFYDKAFGAVEIGRQMTPDGKRVLHATLRIGDSMLMLVDAFPEFGSIDPKALGGSPVDIHLYVHNVDTVFDRAVEAGATVTMPVDDMFWGDRYGRLTDPFGHKWSIATRVREVTPEELEAGASAAFSGPPEG